MIFVKWMWELMYEKYHFYLFDILIQLKVKKIKGFPLPFYIHWAISMSYKAVSILLHVIKKKMMQASESILIIVFTNKFYRNN